ncbi:MAG: intradiol ring-cleavage dioxygenase [Cyclobacteriaceae bacterium]
MFRNILFLLFCLSIYSCQSQTEQPDKKVGGPCEGCEAVHEYGDQVLNAIDTLPGFMENEPKLKLTGKLFKLDGKTPAANTIMYIYHTNARGIYEKKGDETGWGKRHGFIRGWIKTGDDGKYTFYTYRPASYPDTTLPAHIHTTVKEPGKTAYFIDDFFFDDDPYLPQRVREGTGKRGGSGISQPVMKNGILTIERDIILGLNIPNY